jgi:hypothetical protein
VVVTNRHGLNKADSGAPHKSLQVFYILLTVQHLDVILVNDQLDALFLNVFISCLYMFRAASAHHQEGQMVLMCYTR